MVMARIYEAIAGKAVVGLPFSERSLPGVRASCSDRRYQYGQQWENYQMLALGLVNEIKRLLEPKDLSQRQIAKRLGISRGAVGDVAKGRRRTAAINMDEELTAFSDESVLGRCPGCGGKVYMPCLLCQTRSFQRNQRAISRLRHANQLEAQCVDNTNAVA